MKTSHYDFDLPDHLIAQHPVEPRDRSRLMVVRRGAGTWEHRTFSDVVDLLSPGDLLVRNNTRVVPARLLGHRAATGGKWEGLFLRDRGDGSWEMLATTRGRAVVGEEIKIEGGLTLTLEEKGENGRWIVRPGSGENASALLERHGHIPLPPYIRKGRDDPADRLRYQTVFAKQPGAVAAPTAGLHFTPELLARLEQRGIESAEVTLHVGIGTFRPIEAESIEDHTLHAEWAEIREDVAQECNRTKAGGGKIVAVGTTSARTLETAAVGGDIRPFSGETALYLKPGHLFRGIDGLITNFHLPRSSLLVLVAAFAGFDLMRAAYAEAIRENYRFYSYGDAMMIL